MQKTQITTPYALFLVSMYPDDTVVVTVERIIWGLWKSRRTYFRERHSTIWRDYVAGLPVFHTFIENRLNGAMVLARIEKQLNNGGDVC